MMDGKAKYTTSGQAASRNFRRPLNTSSSQFKWAKNYNENSTDLHSSHLNSTLIEYFYEIF